MDSKIKILAFAGSTRKDSYNKKLLSIATEATKNMGAAVTIIDLDDLPMPLYDGDLEKMDGIPANGIKFRELLLDHQGLLIASPEYNSSISGVLKNAIDWASRPVKGQESLAPFKDKVAGLMSASPGSLGGIRGLITLRSILENINVIVIPKQVSVPKADVAFNEKGKLNNEKLNTSVEQVGISLYQLLLKIT